MRIVIILQKPCQNDKLLIISEMAKNEGMEKCAESHDLRANSHTLHGVNVKKASFWGSL